MLSELEILHFSHPSIFISVQMEKMDWVRVREETSDNGALFPHCLYKFWEHILEKVEQLLMEGMSEQIVAYC